jgi:hypothetical protein
MQCACVRAVCVCMSTCACACMCVCRCVNCCYWCDLVPVSPGCHLCPTKEQGRIPVSQSLFALCVSCAYFGIKIVLLWVCSASAPLANECTYSSLPTSACLQSQNMAPFPFVILVATQMQAHTSSLCSNTCRMLPALLGPRRP